MKKVVTGLCLIGIAVASIPAADVLAQRPIRGGRLVRTIDVRNFDDFEIYLPNDTTEISVYAQWTNNGVVVVDDVSFLCLYGPNGEIGGEDDDLTISRSRQTSYTTSRGRFWHTTTVSGQRCWLTLDFQHREQYDRSARARFTIILNTMQATEGTWRRASLRDMELFNQKRDPVR